MKQERKQDVMGPLHIIKKRHIFVSFNIFQRFL